jgi:hypothetical protein
MHNNFLVEIIYRLGDETFRNLETIIDALGDKAISLDAWIITADKHIYICKPAALQARDLT